MRSVAVPERGGEAILVIRVARCSTRSEKGGPGSQDMGASRDGWPPAPSSASGGPIAAAAAGAAPTAAVAAAPAAVAAAPAAAAAAAAVGAVTVDSPAAAAPVVASAADAVTAAVGVATVAVVVPVPVTVAVAVAAVVAVAPAVDTAVSPARPAAAEAFEGFVQVARGHQKSDNAHVRCNGSAGLTWALPARGHIRAVGSRPAAGVWATSGLVCPYAPASACPA